jgi:xylulokinase
MFYLGLDLGTTNVKVLLAGLTGKVVSEGSAGVVRYDTSDGGVEQDIYQIWQATCDAIKKAVSGFDTAEIQAVGVSSQGGALQPLDENGTPLGRVISWLDTRGAEYDKKLTAELGADFFREHIGHGKSIIAPGQILRLKAERTEYFAQIKHFAFVGDVIVGMLTGTRGHDATSLSICCLLNPQTGKADGAILERLGINESQLPKLFSADQLVGQITESAAGLTGLKPGTPVGPAIHDQYAAAIGAGAINSGDMCLATGTAWVLLAITDRLTPPIIDDAFVCPHLYDGLYGQMVSLGIGGSEIQLAMKQIGYEKINLELIDSLLEKAINQPGLNKPADLVYETVVNLSKLLAKQFGLMRNVRINPRRIILTGPAAASRFTPQIIEKVIGLKVECFNEASTSAYGAAVLAQRIKI